MSDIASASLVLSSVVLLVAVLLGWREWAERRERSVELSPEDARHFGQQDTRRTLGLVVMALLAVGLVLGSRIPARLDNRANAQFLAIWFGIFLLIFLLLALALIDWVALRIFARRHRNEILRERIEILKEETRRNKALGANGSGHGHEDGPLGDLFR